MKEAALIAAQIAVECEPDKVIIVGHQAQVSSAPQWAFYAYVPVLNMKDECTRSFLGSRYSHNLLEEADPISGVPRLLCDRFSPEGRWLYGTMVKGENLLIWSPGPDGRMNFSPLKEFRTDDPNLQHAMLLKSYDPTNGMLSSGDLMMVAPLPDPGETGF